MIKKQLSNKSKKLILGSVLSGVVVLSATGLYLKADNPATAEVQTIEDFYSNDEEEEVITNKVVVEEQDSRDERLKSLVDLEEGFIAYINVNEAEVYEVDEKTKSTLSPSTLDIFTEVDVLAESDAHYQVKADGKLFLVSRGDLSKDRNSIFKNIDSEEVRYLRNNEVQLHETPASDSEFVKGRQNEIVKLLGLNEAGLAKVDYKGNIKYVSTEGLMNEQIEINKIEEVNSSKPVKSDNKGSQQVSQKSKPKTRTVKKRAVKATNQDFTKKGQTFACNFSAYYPADDPMQGGFLDAMGNTLVPENYTCAAPPEIPFGTKLLVQGTGTSRDGKVYTVTDRGGAIKMQPDGSWKVDLLMGSRNEAFSFGRRNGTVTIVK